MRILAIIVGFWFCGAADGSQLQTGELNAMQLSPSQLSTCRAAGPQEYLRLCDRFTTQTGAAQCIAIGNGEYFSTCSLDLCHRFTTERGALECLAAIVDKEYTTEEVAMCGRFSTESGAIQCLGSSGTPHENGESDGDTLRDVRFLILDALDFIAQQRYNRAEQSLHEALDRIELDAHP